MSSPIALRVGLLGLALAMTAVGRPAFAADPLAERLIQLRGEVEQLNSELGALQDEQRTTLNGLAAQKAELEASVDRQKLAARELRGKLDEKQQQASDAGVEGEALKPHILSAAEALQQYVRSGLPFKQDERANDIEQFRNDVISGKLPPQRAVNRLWALFEDEFRLTRENGLYSQTVQIGNEKVLADVARIGSMALYFSTQDGRYGRAERAGSGWRFVVVQDGADVERIKTLFDSLRKQIRQGFFELPLAANGGAR